jgi:chromosomal replication initiation ATPase DnaA
MGELAIAPRDLAAHYKTARARLWAPAVPVPAEQPRVQPAHIDNMRELARLRLETKILREFLTEHGIDIDSVINRKPRIPTGGIGKVSMKDILDAVCRRFLVRHIDLIAARRTRALVIPRHVVFYLARSLTGKSLPEIGRHVGRRDHTTVLHGVKRIVLMIRTDPDLANDIAHLEVELGQEG